MITATQGERKEVSFFLCPCGAGFGNPLPRQGPPARGGEGEPAGRSLVSLSPLLLCLIGEEPHVRRGLVALGILWNPCFKEELKHIGSGPTGAERKEAMITARVQAQRVSCRGARAGVVREDQPRAEIYAEKHLWPCRREGRARGKTREVAFLGS